MGEVDRRFPFFPFKIEWTTLTNVFRILDANMNRCVEGLRVVEDYARMILNHSPLTERVKDMRHELSRVLPPEDPRRLVARDVRGDVGVVITTPVEYVRPTSREVAIANISRVAESFRSLEEYAKTLGESHSRTIEQLRYKWYEIGQAILLAGTPRERMKDISLCVLLDGNDSTAKLRSLASSLLGAGVRCLQLRDKKLSDRELFVRAKELRALTHSFGALVIVNDRPDIANLAGADGVHVGQDDLSPKDVRAIVGTDAIVGFSTHKPDDLLQAEIEPVDYVGCGPTFSSTTKSFERFAGLEFLRFAAGRKTLPAFAIGGIRSGNVGQVLETGVSRVAIAAGITKATDPASEARVILNKILNAKSAAVTTSS